MSSIVARSADDVWAVGERSAHGSGEPRGRTSTLHWDGVRWHVVPSPNRWWSTRLTSVDVVAGTPTAWAVGVAEPRGGGDADGLVLRGAAQPGAAFVSPSAPAGSATSRCAVASSGRSGPATSRPRVRDAPDTRCLEAGASAHRAGPLQVVAAQPRGDLWASDIDTLFRLEGVRWRTARTLRNGTSAIGLTFPSPVDGLAVGGKPTGGEWLAPFAMRRHGSRWTRSPVPSPSGASALVAIDGTLHDLWAIAAPVGYSGSSIAFHRC